MNLGGELVSFTDVALTVSVLLTAVLIVFNFVNIRRVRTIMEAVLSATEDVTAEVQKLNGSLDFISAGIGGLTTTLALATARISELETSGVSGPVLDSLKAAVKRGGEIAAALVPAVDPAQETPAVETLPAPPVDAAPAPEVPSPATPEAPVVPAEELPAPAPVEEAPVATEAPAEVTPTEEV